MRREFEPGGFVFMCACMRVCVCAMKRQQQQIIGEAHLDSAHLSTLTRCPSNQHYSLWVHTVYVCVVTSYCPASQGLHVCVCVCVPIFTDCPSPFSVQVSVCVFLVCVRDGAGESSRSLSRAIKDSALTDDLGQIKKL